MWSRKLGENCFSQAFVNVSSADWNFHKKECILDDEFQKVSSITPSNKPSYHEPVGRKWGGPDPGGERRGWEDFIRGRIEGGMRVRTRNPGIRYERAAVRISPGEVLIGWESRAPAHVCVRASAPFLTPSPPTSLLILVFNAMLKRPVMATNWPWSVFLPGWIPRHRGGRKGVWYEDLPGGGGGG